MLTYRQELCHTFATARQYYLMMRNMMMMILIDGNAMRRPSHVERRYRQASVGNLPKRAATLLICSHGHHLAIAHCKPSYFYA